MKQKSSKKKNVPWHQTFLIALVILLALLLIFSRGYRAARRAGLPGGGQAEQPYNMNKQQLNDHMQPSDPYKDALTPEMLLGHIDPAGDPRFSQVAADHASRTGMYMRKEAYDAFLQMQRAAQQDGIVLTILSATRPFAHQKRIWDNKWFGRQELHGGVFAPDIEDPVDRALEILRFSAMPGTSRHHWGTDIDLNSLQNEYFVSGDGKKVYEWLVSNAGTYGFCQPYTAHGKHRQGGYEEEKWHWSYKPLASLFLREYEEQIGYGDIRGFAGDTLARQLRVIERYVLDVNSGCY